MSLDKKSWQSPNLSIEMLAHCQHFGLYHHWSRATILVHQGIYLTEMVHCTRDSFRFKYWNFIISAKFYSSTSLTQNSHIYRGSIKRCPWNKCENIKQTHLKVSGNYTKLSEPSKCTMSIVTISQWRFSVR